MTPTDKNHAHDLRPPAPRTCSASGPGGRGGRHFLGASGGTSLTRPVPELAVSRRRLGRGDAVDEDLASMRELGALAWAGDGPDCGVHACDGWRAPVSAQVEHRNRTGLPSNHYQSPPTRLRPRLRRRPAL